MVVPSRVLPNDSYELELTINPDYVFLFELEGPASVSAPLRIDPGSPHPSGSRLSNGETATRPGLPSMAPHRFLPDLVALPAWDISLRQSGERTFLVFSATIWNAGDGPLDVRGKRRSKASMMKAYQYIRNDVGQFIGRVPVGKFEYDARPGHSHWHFSQFASYKLVREGGRSAQRSRKESFCLASVEPIDLVSLPAAEVDPKSIGFNPTCGDIDSKGIREQLGVGWGDTYTQSLPGQAFDVTNLSDGEYYVTIEANPDALMHETSVFNNTSWRPVSLRTENGVRQVLDSPYGDVQE
jgi:hypothetical protein